MLFNEELMVLVDNTVDIHYTRWGGVAGVVVGVEWGDALADEVGVDHIEAAWDPPSIVLKETKLVGHKKIILPQTQTQALFLVYFSSWYLFVIE